MQRAYQQRDINAYLASFNEFSRKYKKLPASTKAVYRGAYARFLYNLCCTYSLLDDKNNALSYLQQSIKAGYVVHTNIQTDPDLNNIRGETRFKDITGPVLLAGRYIDQSEAAKQKGLIDSMVFYARQATIATMKYKNVYEEEIEPWSLAALGYILWWAGNYPDALETYLAALEKAEPFDDPLLHGALYNGIGAVYRNQGKYRQAIQYFTKAEQLTKDLPLNNEFYSAIIDKGKAYEQLGMLDSAYAYVQTWMAAKYSVFKDSTVVGSGEIGMGIIYSKMGKVQLAEEFFRQGLQLDAAAKDYRLLARAYGEYAEHFERHHLPDSAIYYATKAFLQDKQHSLLVYQLASSSLLAKLYAGQNNIDSAFKYQQVMIQLQDSLFNDEKISRMHSLEFKEQLRQIEMAAQNASMAQARKRNIQYLLIAVGLVSFVVVFLLLSRSFITSSRLIKFLGVVALLLVFEFLNLLLHPFLEQVTHHSPILMLLCLAAIASMLVPLHHRLEKWTLHTLVEKNRKIRLARARETIKALSDPEERV